MKEFRRIAFLFCFLPLPFVVSVAQKPINASDHPGTPEAAGSPGKDPFVSYNEPVRQKYIDHSFLTTLSAAGINDACQEMNISFNEVFAPMAAGIQHPYRQYRWSVSRDEHDNPVIHALPPEEETGWTPWERWSMKGNIPIRTAWVLYPVKEPIKGGIVRWYKLEESENLMPRLLHRSGKYGYYTAPGKDRCCCRFVGHGL